MPNRPKSFQNSQAVEKGLSDFHKMCLTVMEIIQCQSYKTFSNGAFINDL